ncbi:MAG: hypothetical protein ACQCN6_04490 [Candidatus Bathyarchaeia archaeon]
MKHLPAACGLLHNQSTIGSKPRSRKAIACQAHRKKKGKGGILFI